MKTGPRLTPRDRLIYRGSLARVSRIGRSLIARDISEGRINEEQPRETRAGSKIASFSSAHFVSESGDPIRSGILGISLIATPRRRVRHLPRPNCESVVKRDRHSQIDGSLDNIRARAWACQVSVEEETLHATKGRKEGSSTKHEGVIRQLGAKPLLTSSSCRRLRNAQEVASWHVSRCRQKPLFQQIGSDTSVTFSRVEVK